MSYQAPESFYANRSEYKVIVFLSVLCPCSRSHVEHLNDLQEKYKEVSFHGVIVDSVEYQKLIQDYFTADRFSFSLLKDPQQVLIRDFNALKTPHIVLLKRQSNGKYKRLYEGGLSNQRDFSKSSRRYLQENLLALFEGRDLPYKHGRSLGCYIRRF